MKLRFGSLFILLLVAACGPKVKLPAGAPALLSDNALWESIDKQALSYKQLELKGSGRYSDNEGSSLSFRFTLRVQKDSIIWVDLADPILGLKLVRAKLTSQKVSYYNRLDRTYFEGSSEELAQQAGLNFEFEPLMAILSANVLKWQQKWQQNYLPEYYELNNFPRDSLNPPSGEIQLIRQLIRPQNFRPQYLELKRPSQGEIVQVNYHDYKEFGDIIYPSFVKLRLLQQSDQNLELDIRSVERNQNLSFPYRIPNNYDAL